MRLLVGSLGVCLSIRGEDVEGGGEHLAEVIELVWRQVLQDVLDLVIAEDGQSHDGMLAVARVVRICRTRDSPSEGITK